MKRYLILLPFLFFGIKPYNQNTGIEMTDKNSTVFSIKADTMMLSYTVDLLIQEEKELNELKAYKKRLESEYKRKKEAERLKRIRIQKEKQEAKLLKEIKNDINNFLNRGI